MKPYLIEGLDCSGKKAVAGNVVAMLENKGYPAIAVIGPLCNSGLRAFDQVLVNSTNIKSGSLLDSIRKTTYALEPVIDGIMRRESRKCTIKISSHYRAWARAIVESDFSMIKKFQKHANQHVKYSGAALLWTDFDKRVLRHKQDVIENKTSKIESKRFFNYNKDLFESWHFELYKLLEVYIGSVVHINTTYAEISDISNEVFEHMLGLV